MTRNVVADLSDHTEHGERDEHGHAPGHGMSEAEVLAALWEQVPFPRLPRDAPAELRDLVIDVENPKMVYNIHRASRRYYLQLLVERFVVQLRYGCGVTTCSTPSCFTCRRRLAGKSPIRRYNPTSARTLAIYLAGQDNPESRLCPNLQPPKAPSDSIKPLIFPPKCPTSLSGNGQRRSKVAPHSHSQQDPPRERPGSRPSHRASDRPLPIPIHATTTAPTSPRPHNTNHDRIPNDDDQENVPPPNSFTSTQISEKAVTKDYRSFAANVFGTVAFKMLEWLTPNTLEAIAEKAEAALEGSDPGNKGTTPNPSSMGDAEDGLSEPTTIPSSRITPRIHDSRSIEENLETHLMPVYGPDGEGGTDAIQNRNSGRRDSLDPPVSRRPPSHSRKSSHARIRTSSLTKPPTKGVEPISDDSALPSPTPRSNQPEIVSKSIIRPSNITRTTSQLSTDKSVEGEGDELTQALEAPHSHPDEWPPLVDGVNADDASSYAGVSPSPLAESVHSQAITDPLDLTSELDSFLPQSLSHFTIQAIDFLCNILQDDATCESHLLEPRIISKDDALKYQSSLTMLKRKRRKSKRYSQNLKLQWKLFAEQSIFNVLSNPRAVLESFTNHDGLIDSYSIWYCMLRLTRVAPSLVFDSLWMALSGLFSPPRPLQSTTSSTSKLFPRSTNSFTNAEAGFIMSICLHALVAAAPLVTDARQLIDMSRIRAHGLSLTNGGSIARQPTSLCLKYEDTFTDDLALRLAKRLLTMITARSQFDLLMEFDRDSEREQREQDKDVLEVFLAHLESATHVSSSTSKLERSLHEKRVPILILDWARTVMFNEWEGNADVPRDGPFSGALALMAAMYQKRQSLLLGDGSFFAEYFGERLDSVQMPVSWMTFDAVQRIHLLDHPYLFTPDSRVSYFRAINFSRMSRSYEESSSLQDRIEAIIKHGSLITEPHHRNVLQDLLKVPSSRYLILSIGRSTVLEDAFDQLWRREERELMRPLKVHLGEDSGEEGFDSGGVQQEFFRLAIAEALNPDYGAFTVDDRTRMTWFQPGSLQPEWKFELVGLLMSLAVYNGLTLPVTFPKALYQKLLGQPVTELHHIADGWPDHAHSLTTLLEWDEKDGSVEDVFALTYEFSTSMFGKPVTREMQPESSTGWEDAGNGSDSERGWPQFSALHGTEPPSAGSSQPGAADEAPSVTGDNRNAYVSDYIRYLATVSVGPQFEAFARGFRRCLQAKSLTLLTPGLLQSLVEGEQEVDVAELRRAARYVGWDATHRTVRDFWAVVRRYDAPMRRRLLEFVTASDRVPVGGVRNVQFVVQRNGDEPGDRGHLPTAYTCYGTLLLPEYRDREVLRERLAMALENAQGFGFA